MKEGNCSVSPTTPILTSLPHITPHIYSITPGCLFSQLLPILILFYYPLQHPASTPTHPVEEEEVIKKITNACLGERMCVTYVVWEDGGGGGNYSLWEKCGKGRETICAVFN